MPLCDPKNHDEPHPTKTISYTNASEDLRHVLTLIGVDPTGFGEHSMKRGGATEAARLGATADEICIAGDWSSATTASKYIDQPSSHNQILQKFLK